MAALLALSAIQHARAGKVVGGDAFERLAARIMVNQPITGTVHYIHDQRGRVIAETDGTGQMRGRQIGNCKPRR